MTLAFNYPWRLIYHYPKNPYYIHAEHKDPVYNIRQNVTQGQFLKGVKLLIGVVGRVFANVPWDLGSIPGRVIPKTLKWYLIPPCLTLSNIRYVSRVKWSNPGKGVTPFTTPRCGSYWKESLLVTLDYGRQQLNRFKFRIFLFIDRFPNQG